MRLLRWLALFVFAAWLALVQSRAGAQLVEPGPDSDILSDTVAGNFEPAVTPQPIVRTKTVIPESGEGNGMRTLTIPALTVDFIEAGTTATKSDRFHLDSYNVQFTPDADPGGGLPPRSDATMIGPEANEMFTPLQIRAISNAETPVGGSSDFVDMKYIVNGQTNFVGFKSVDEPSSEATAEAKIQIALISPLKFDVYDANGRVSDYVDIPSVSGFFLSSDVAADYTQPDVLFDPDYVIREGADISTLDYRLNFASDVPEPGALLLFFSGLTVLGAYVRWRRRSLG